MSLFDNKPLFSPKEQSDPRSYFGGRLFWDNYYQHSPDDSELWLRLMSRAYEISPDLSAALQMIRNTGARLIESDKYGYRIEPVTGGNGWNSKEEYDRGMVSGWRNIRHRLWNC